MFTAPKRMNEDRLNERVPLSVGQWHAHGEQFALDIDWRSIFLGLSLGGDHNRAEQTCIDIFRLIDVGMIPPDRGAGFPRAGSAPRVGRPGIGIALSRFHAAARA